MYGSATVCSLGPKIWDSLATELKRIVCPTLFKKKKRKFVNGLQEIVHVVCIKRIYKALDFCNLTVRTYLALQVEIF